MDFVFPRLGAFSKIVLTGVIADLITIRFSGVREEHLCRVVKFGGYLWIGVNKEEIKIEASRVPSFKAGKALKDIIAK